MLFSKSPIGYIQIPSWEEEKLILLSDEQLLELAISENENFVIRPAVFAMIEKRNLYTTLQRLINPSVGLAHNSLHGTASIF
jgi:hypothetical protein